MGKQMGGDNRQRRQRVREAREEGTTASEAGVTVGASKQDHSLGNDADHDEKMEAPGRGVLLRDRAGPLRDAKTQVLRAVRRFEEDEVGRHTVRARYTARNGRRTPHAPLRRGGRRRSR